MIGEKDNVSEAETLIFYLGDNWIIVDFVDWVKLPISDFPLATRAEDAAGAACYPQMVADCIRDTIHSR
jgi:hypothetical protein